MNSWEKTRTNLWYYIKNYKFNSIFLRSFIIIILLIVLPVSGMVAMVYNIYNSIVRDEISTTSVLSLSRIKDMVEIMVRTNHNLINLIEYDKQVQVFMLSNVASLQDDGLYQPSYFFRLLSTYINTSDFIDSIYLYSQMSDFVISNRHNGPLQQFSDREWYDGYMRSTNENGISSMARQGEDPYSNTKYNFITLIKPVKNLGVDTAGAIVLNIDILELGKLIEKVNNKQIDDIYIMDKNSYVIYNKDLSKINASAESIPSLKGLINVKGDYSSVSGSGKDRQIISYVTSQFNQWSYASVMPLEFYEQRITYLRNFMIGFIVLSILIAIVVSFLISVRTFNPIKNIITVIENPEKWAELEDISDRSDFNEIMYITRNIVNSFSKSRKMEKELAHRLMLLKSAQTAALQSQISPHFLYNTLTTINWMAIGLTKCDNEVSAMVLSLSELLRLSLESGDSLITVDKELKHARRYVEIQQIRYKNKFEVIWNIDHTILEYKVVKITLQPIIENAIYHGIKPKKEKGTIKIRGCNENNNVVFEVEDDGAGMEQEYVDKIKLSIDQEYVKSDDEHIGIKNVNQRIKLIFGEQYGITIKSQLEKGTVVRIVMPVIK